MRKPILTTNTPTLRYVHRPELLWWTFGWLQSIYDEKRIRTRSCCAVQGMEPASSRGEVHHFPDPSVQACSCTPPTPVYQHPRWLVLTHLCSALPTFTDRYDQQWKQLIKHPSITNRVLTVFVTLEKCFLSNDVYDYMIIAQGKTTIPNVDDGEEMGLTDVRLGTLVWCYSVFLLVFLLLNFEIQ